MVKKRKTKSAPKRRRDSLASLRPTAAQRRKQEEAYADQAEEYERARERGEVGPQARPVSSFGLLYSARTRDAVRSGGRDARLTMRLHPDLRDLLVVSSRREHRTLSQLVELILVDYARSAVRRLDDAEIKALGWDAKKLEQLAGDPHPFARDLYARLTRAV